MWPGWARSRAFAPTTTPGRSARTWLRRPFSRWAPISTFHSTPSPRIGFPMLRRILLLLPIAVCAATLTPIGSPKDPQGNNLPLGQAGRMFDGTWTVSDKSQTTWYSTDEGAKWDKIPTDSATNYAEVFGSLVVTSAFSQAWNRTAGWQKISFPPECHQVGDGYTSSGGLSGTIDSVTKQVLFCRSDRELLNWKVWFRMDTTALPKGFSDPFGDAAFHSIWYAVNDSGYMRGTSDGISWNRVNFPSGFSVVTQIAGTDSFFFVTGTKSGETEPWNAFSTDTGATWKSGPISQPGIIAIGENNGVFLSLTQNPKRPNAAWGATSPNGPWEFIDSTKSTRLILEKDALFLAKPTGFFRVQLNGLAVRPVTTHAHLEIRTTPSGLQIQFPENLRGMPWSIRGISGSEIASGRTRSTLELARQHGPAWLYLANQTIALPPL